MFLFGGRVQRVELRMKRGWWSPKFSQFCSDVDWLRKGVGTCVFFRERREVLSVYLRRNHDCRLSGSDACGLLANTFVSTLGSPVPRISFHTRELLSVRALDKEIMKEVLLSPIFTPSLPLSLSVRTLDKEVLTSLNFQDGCSSGYCRCELWTKKC